MNTTTYYSNFNKSMELYSVSPKCFDKEVINISNIYGIKNIEKKDSEGKWYKEHNKPTIDDQTGFIYIKNNSDCTTTRDKLVKDIENLQKRVSELEQKKLSSHYDNIICNCISFVYNIIVKEVNKAHPEVNVWSWASMILIAEVKQEISSYIDDIRRQLGINDTQWQKIKKFKEERNKKTHGSETAKENANEALYIITNFINDCDPELKSGLTLVAEIVSNN